MTRIQLSRRLPATRSAAIVTTVVLSLLTLGMVATRAEPSDERATSDRFWAAMSVTAVEVEYYDSLDSLTRGAEVVVRGSMRGLSPNRSFGGPADAEPVQFATITIQVIEVLAGRLANGAEPTVLELVVPGGLGAIDALRESVPTEEAIFFLRNKGTEVAGWGWAKDRVAVEGQFYRLVNSQALLRNFDGRAAAPVGVEVDFLKELDGQPFSDVSESIKAMR